MSMEFKEYPDREMLALSLADRLASQLSQHLRAHEAASLCVPGGTSPMQVFDTLSGSDLDWGRVTVFLGDERWVDGEHKRSNSRLLRRHLLQDKAAAARYIDLYTGDPQPDDATGALAEAIAPHLPITVALLGMGNDMHTASLFPGADHLEAALASDGRRSSRLQHERWPPAREQEGDREREASVANTGDRTAMERKMPL